MDSVSKTTNPFETSGNDPDNRRIQQTHARHPVNHTGVRLSVFAGHIVLLLMFPPTCCPCGFGPIGFLIQPYLILLGLPTILVPLLFPAIREDHIQLMMIAYIINFVLLSYVVGEFAGKWYATNNRRRPERRLEHRNAHIGTNNPMDRSGGSAAS